MVAGRAEEDVLDFLIARGTAVMARHETALVDLCSSVSEDDKEIEDCVVNFLSSAYDDDVEDIAPICEEDEDCLFDNVFENMWGEELKETTPMPRPEQPLEQDKAPKVTKPLPWRSRSSPSGTFVRDPKTGKMKNIDKS